MKNGLPKSILSVMFSLVLSACGGGGGGGSAAAPAPTSAPAPEVAGAYNPFDGGFSAVPSLTNNNQTSCKVVSVVPTNSTIQGKLVFERVPLSAVGSALNYNNIVASPSRGVVVEAVSVVGGSCTNTVVVASLTDGEGDYGLVVPAGQQVCVRARAQMARSGTPRWNFNVTDNAQSNAPYYLELTGVVTAGTIGAPLNLAVLGARSGWDAGASAYTQTRAAAAFAILDTACEALDTVLQQNANLVLPQLNFRWSTQNKTVDGDISLGEIGGPFYSFARLVDASGNTLEVSNDIFLLGDEDSDTDEYDQHVVAHEFSHFFSQSVARSDSVGGVHGTNDLLDMSVAFEEGFADAFSGIALKDVSSAVLPSPKTYRDTFGNNQATGFLLELDERFGSSIGWYSETSVYNFVYNAFDSVNSGSDNLSMGFAPLYAAWVNQRNKEASVSLFSFINSLKIQNPGDSIDIDTLAAEESIESVVDDFGSSEVVTNNTQIQARQDVMPVYEDLVLNTALNNVCSNNQFQRQNGLSVIQRLKFNAASAGNYRFTVTPQAGLTAGKVTILVQRQGVEVINQSSDTIGESFNSVVMLSAGVHIIWIADTDNSNDEGGTPGRRCFTVQVD